MERTLFTEKQDRLLLCLDKGKPSQSYQLLWDEKTADDLAPDDSLLYSYAVKKLSYRPTMTQIKEFVLSGMSDQIRERIVNGFEWEGKPVRLSLERQINLKEIYDLAVQSDGDNLPIKMKLGNDADGFPVYHTFKNVSSLTEFYKQSVTYKQLCLKEGRKRKESVDWSRYEL